MHTFKVKLADVCGSTKVADYKYTQKVRKPHERVDLQGSTAASCMMILKQATAYCFASIHHQITHIWSHPSRA